MLQWSKYCVIINHNGLSWIIVISLLGRHKCSNKIDELHHIASSHFLKPTVLTKFIYNLWGGRLQSALSSAAAGSCHWRVFTLKSTFNEETYGHPYFWFEFRLSSFWQWQVIAGLVNTWIGTYMWLVKWIFLRCWWFLRKKLNIFRDIVVLA